MTLDKISMKGNRGFGQFPWVDLAVEITVINNEIHVKNVIGDGWGAFKYGILIDDKLISLKGKVILTEVSMTAEGGRKLNKFLEKFEIDIPCLANR